MNTVLTRIISAIVAILIIFFLFYFKGVEGLKYLIYFAVILSTRECYRMLFFKNSHPIWRLYFIVLSVGVFFSSILSPFLMGNFLLSAFVLTVIPILLLESQFDDIEQVFKFISLFFVGIVYSGALPATTYLILTSHQGIEWFALLLLVVFSGDTMAYFSGMLLGKKKILPRISPKKTIIGSIGGVTGSLVTTLIFFKIYFPQISAIWGLGIGITVSVAAQVGDFFESLLKRIADIKDSGKIMPGHGGILDRIDGLLFGAPIMLLWIHIINFFS